MKKFFAFILIVFVASVVVTLTYVDRALFKSVVTESVVFEIQKGGSAQKTAQKLADQKFVSHPILALLAMRFYGFDKNLKAGEYLIEKGMTLKDILQKLTSGKVIMHQLTLPEGLTTAQMLALIEQNEFLSGTVTQNVLEGEMLPETYTFAKGKTKDSIIKKAKADMQKALDEIWQKRAEDLPLKDKNELLILASIIEKETGVNAERQMVASVFINRLNIDMPLQTDPTVIYAITGGKTDLKRSLKRNDLSIDSPYNTYLYKGLPPTPICSPGKAALEAAADPAQTQYLYFVADGKGGHRFAKTLSEHNENIKLWLKK